MGNILIPADGQTSSRKAHPTTLSPSTGGVSRRSARGSKVRACSTFTYRLCAERFEALMRSVIDDTGEVGLPPHQLAEFQDVQPQQCARLDCDYRRRARGAGQQRNLAKELPGPKPWRFRADHDLDLARRDEIHAVAGISEAHDDSSGGIVARPQKPRHLGDG